MADARHGPGRGVDRRTVVRTGAVAAGLVWARPVVRTVTLRGATGTPEPTTTTPTTAEPPPTMVVEAVSFCRGTAPFAILVEVSGFEPNTQYSIGLGNFTTDGDGAGLIEAFEFADQPFTAHIVIWPDPNGNRVQDPGEPTVFSGTFVNDTPCKSGPFTPD